MKVTKLDCKPPMQNARRGCKTCPVRPLVTGQCHGCPKIPGHVRRPLCSRWDDPASKQHAYSALAQPFMNCGLSQRFSRHRCRPRYAFRSWRERQKKVAGNSVLKSDVARICENHTARDDRSCGANRAALAAHTVDSFHLLDRVECPKRGPVDG